MCASNSSIAVGSHEIIMLWTLRGESKFIAERQSRVCGTTRESVRFKSNQFRIVRSTLRRSEPGRAANCRQLEVAFVVAVSVSVCLCLTPLAISASICATHLDSISALSASSISGSIPSGASSASSACTSFRQCLRGRRNLQPTNWVGRHHLSVTRMSSQCLPISYL